MLQCTFFRKAEVVEVHLAQGSSLYGTDSRGSSRAFSAPEGF
jgi:hypothetical protein